MTLLLDTHAFLWWLNEERSLSTRARRAIADTGTTVFVSAATIWEIAIKRSIGKLEAPTNLVDQVELNQFEPLPISLAHAATAGSLPMLHNDPFDRMLVAQAVAEGLTIVTRDPRITQYGVPTLTA